MSSSHKTQKWDLKEQTLHKETPDWPACCECDINKEEAECWPEYDHIQAQVLDQVQVSIVDPQMIKVAVLKKCPLFEVYLI